MQGLIQEFFYTPDETVSWLKKVIPEFGLWAVQWIVGEDAREIDVALLRPDILFDRAEDSVQFFVGGAKVSRQPAWRNIGGKRLIDLQSSYAVQLVAPVVAPDRETLLQGRLAILRSDQYDNGDMANELSALFRALRMQLRRESDHNRVIVQVLSDGRKKVWKNILLGKGVPGPGIKQLKQFAKGEVSFDATAV